MRDWMLKYLGIVTEKFDGLFNTQPGEAQGNKFQELHLSSLRISWGSPGFQNVFILLDQHISPPLNPHIVLFTLEV